MKVRDLQLYLRYSLSKDILLSFVRSNFLGLISIFVIVNAFLVALPIVSLLLYISNTFERADILHISPSVLLSFEIISK